MTEVSACYAAEPDIELLRIEQR